MLKVPTTLTNDMEEIVYKTIGCGIAVHRALGPGLLEQIYVRAISIELEAQGVPYVSERQYPVHYRGRLISQQRLDLVVADHVALEVKSVEQLAPVHHAQLLSYLHISGLRVGLLMNFNVPILQDGLKRIVV
jgi:GxxExxY protein